MPIHTDVLVIGAGPAGSAAAIEAQRKGLTVTVIDKATFPREKCCGDGLTTGALRHLDELGLDPNRIPSWRVVEDVQVAGPARKLTSFPLPKGLGQFAAVARRSELDAELVNLARMAGAQIDEGTSLEAVTQHADHVEVQAGGKTYEAKMLIAADGIWSPTRKLLGLTTKGYRGDSHGFRQYFHNVGPQASQKFCVWFEPDLLPGYVWSFPLADNTVNVGFGIVRSSSASDSRPTVRDMKRLWPDILERPHIREVLGADAIPEAPHKALPIPACLPSTILTEGRVIFVGDAGRATDPLTGEGIGQALETGMLAARVIAAAGVEAPAQATENYERTLRAGMVKDHQLAGLLSKVVATKMGASVSLRLCSLTPWTRRNFARWLFEDYPRAVLGTPRRWERGLFHRPGAYQENA